MIRRPLSFETVSVAFVAGTIHSAVAPNLDHPEFSSARIRKLSREARTVSQFKTLADFYETRRRMYVRKAAEQMHSLSKRNGAAKASDDPGRNLYEFYLRQAAKSAAICGRYNRLVDSTVSQ
jgi:hypothetical protein